MSIFNRAMVVIWSLCSATAVAEADWVLRGGTVYSMDETATHYRVAFSGNRLVWLGETEGSGYADWAGYAGYRARRTHRATGLY